MSCRRRCVFCCWGDSDLSVIAVKSSHALVGCSEGGQQTELMLAR
jgi:hypothetical protein